MKMTDTMIMCLKKNLKYEFVLINNFEVEYNMIVSNRKIMRNSKEKTCISTWK